MRGRRTTMDLWNCRRDIKKFNKISKDKQNEIIQFMLSDKAANYYNYTSVLSDLIKYITDEVIVLKLFNHFIKKGTNSNLSNDATYTVIYEIHKKVKNKQSIKDVIANGKNKRLHRAFLLLNDRTEKEEELGLRSLADAKYAPDIFFTRKYKPSLEATKNLPPITRLKTFETLLNNTNIAYNLFEGFANEDEFKALLFGAVLRYRDRVEMVCEKYREMQNFGQESVIVIKCICENCGKYEIAIKSTQVRTKTGLNATNLGRYLSSNSCLLCGRWDENKKQIICEKEQD